MELYVPPKIAFCFLLYDRVIHRKIWEEFFSQDEDDLHTIYSHVKNTKKSTSKWIKDAKIDTVETSWCGEGLVLAWVNMIKEGLKDPDNKYFCILSGECIPLYNFYKTYKKITKKYKSRINAQLNEAYRLTGLVYADQWAILTRREAELLVDVIYTQEGMDWTDDIYNRLLNPNKEELPYSCPDEIYPVNWFLKKYQYSYKNKIDSKVSTYTHWSGDVHPDKLNKAQVLELKDEICSSGAIFARKFTRYAANEIAMKC